MQPLTIKAEWKERTLHSSVKNQLDRLASAFKKHASTHKTANYPAIFSGSEGTGKKMAAAEFARLTGKEVYYIDLSQLASKYIGETEKNIAKIFDAASTKNWILFFDEADALFGKRTDVKDAHDRYANQEVSYLLQRIEQYDGIVIVASKNKCLINDGVLRRFRTIIDFPSPPHR